MNGNGKHLQYGPPPQPASRSAFGPANRVGKSLSGLMHDIVDLAELQWQLLTADVAVIMRSSQLAAAMIAAAGVLALSSLPVLLLAAGWALSEYTELGLPLSMLLSGVLLGLVPAGLLAWLGIRRLLKDVKVLNRSREELTRNIAWLKQSMKTHSGR